MYRALKPFSPKEHVLALVSMKFNRIYILVVLLVHSTGISAQSTLSGRSIDKDSIPMMSATILLLNHADSTYITGSASEFDGRFEILDLKPNHYILSFSMIGFKKTNILQQVGQNTYYDLGDIILEEIVYTTLKQIYESLPQEIFQQVHRSFIVNIYQVNAIDGNQLNLDSNKIPVARNFRDKIYKIILKNHLITRN